jgi:hypothetical protein
VANFTEAQDEQENQEVVDLFNEQDQEPQAEETQEPEVEQSQQPEAEEEEVPSKYKGKSLKDIVKMHQEAEKLIGRQAQEVGEVRKLADELIKRQLSTPKVEEKATEEDEIDFFEDPKKAVQKAVDKHPAVLQAQQAALELKKVQTLNRLQSDYPDFQQTIADPEFANWIKSSNVRMRLYAAADSQYDYEAAAELLSTWGSIRGAKTTKQVEETKQIAKEQRSKAMKAATVDTGTVGLESKKTYRRADLIRLQIQDPDRYAQLQDEIMSAYAEGRVI